MYPPLENHNFSGFVCGFGAPKPQTTSNHKRTPPRKCFTHQGLWFYIHAPSGKTAFLGLGRYGFWGGGFVYSCLLGMGRLLLPLWCCVEVVGVWVGWGQAGSGCCFPFRGGLGDFPCEGQIGGYLCLRREGVGADVWKPKGTGMWTQKPGKAFEI